MSLNRTFVLPSVPRTIEFQLQGDELVDIYRASAACLACLTWPVVYDESIFALEPATVRVREVGVARHERRALRRQRELERTQRANAGLPPLPPDEDDSLVDPDQPASTEPAPFADAAATPSADPDEPVRTTDATTTSSAHGPATPSPNPAGAPLPRTTPELAFSTFQQLGEIPPVPASVLASAFVIPRAFADAIARADTAATYETVVGSTPQPSQDGFPGFVQSADAQRTPDMSADDSGVLGVPLLSPISLLANHPARSSGPPGLFFVSRGRGMTGIVDADGRSVIRRPIHWAGADALPRDTPETLRALDVFSRIEALVVPSREKTVLIGTGPTTIHAVDVCRPVAAADQATGAFHTSIEVVPKEARLRKPRTNEGFVNLRDVVYLARHDATLYWAERVGTSVIVHSVSAEAS